MHDLSRFAVRRLQGLKGSYLFDFTWEDNLRSLMHANFPDELREALYSEKAVASSLADFRLETLNLGEKAVLMYVIIRIPSCSVISPLGLKNLLRHVFQFNPGLREKVIRDRGLTEESAACLEGLIKPAFKAALSDRV